MNKTRISWTDLTWNPVSGCSKVSPGCQNCYAEAGAWIGTTEMSSSVMSMAHEVYGEPGIERTECDVYKESIGRE